MINKLKTLLSLAPKVDFVGFEDGLLVVRGNGKLKFHTTSVKVRSVEGTALAAVLVESYDQQQEVFRLRLLEPEKVPKKLIEQRTSSHRLPKILRTSSPHYPGFTATTEDLSVDGVRVNTKTPLELAYDIRVTIELDDPDLPAIQTFADVVWTGQKFDGSYHSGLRFQGLEQETKSTVKRYINTRLATEKRLHTLEDVDPMDLV